MVGFYLKKFVSFFVEPFGFTLLLIFAAFYFLFKKRHRALAYTLVSLFFYIFLLAYPPFSNMLVAPLEERYPAYRYDANISYVHVLGNANTDDLSQPHSSLLSDSGLKRVVEGVVIYKRQPGVKLLFSGYEGSSQLPNALANKTVAVELGVDPEDIMTDPKARDTKEETLFAKSIVGEQRFVLVTSAMHMPRAMMLFEAAGLHPIAAPCDFEKEQITTLFRTPSWHYLENSQKAIHEYLGILWEML